MVPVSRRGITVLELAVTLSIITLLATVTISAVQHVREQSRLLACRNNLHQIGTAIANYEFAFRVFPQAASSGSFHVSLLPYLDQRALFDEYQTASTSGEADTYSAFGERNPAPGVYLCPSEAAPDYAIDASQRFFSTSYLGNFGTGVQAHGFNGIFQRAHAFLPDVYPEGYVRVADVRDGLGQTAAVSEIAHSTGRPERFRTYWQTPNVMADPNQLDAFASLCKEIPPTPSDYGWRGDSMHLGSPWTRGDVAFTLYNHVLGPQSPSCSNGGLWQLGIVSANSMHSETVNVLYADGRVAGVAATIDLAVWREAGSRSDAVLIHLPPE